jgi:hypothetical protein
MLTYSQFLFESKENAQPIGSYGKFSPSSKKDAPLIFVFGGIPVGGRQSGDYMYDYFNKTKDNYHLFVAASAKVNGIESYNNVMSKAQSLGLKPKKKVLYLFSGGYRPGMSILKKIDPKQFDKIYIVDIWMGKKNPAISEFYIKIASQIPDKVEYYYTDFGAQNNQARDKMARTVKTKLRNQANAHMGTQSSVNVDAVAALMKYTKEGNNL